MMSEKVDVNWAGDMAFDTEIDGHKLRMDAVEAVGGKDQGPRPKPLLLSALGGCTGIDVVSILNKMRVEFDYFNIEVSAESTEEHPKFYNKIHVIYQFRGKDLPMDKLEKAVNLSQDRYCGVSFMLGKAAEITKEIVILD